MKLIKMEDLDLAGKRVLIREDLNVPVKNGAVTSDARIRAALPTINLARKAGARVILMSHLGRPTEGVNAAEQGCSLAPVAARLENLLGQSVRLIEHWQHGIEVQPGDVVMLENIRCNAGEKKNDEGLARKLAALCDIFVMDAFGTAHRAQASTEGVARYAPIACAGPLLAQELDALQRALAEPQRPFVAIVGGSKVSTKLEVLEQLAKQVDQLVLGGGIANTFLAAAGKPVGKSLHEPDLIDTAKHLLRQTHIPLPADVVVAKEFSEQAVAVTKAADQVAEDEMILDIGPQAARELAALLKDAKTIIWNGPVGVFEFDQFGKGTEVLARAIADSEAFSIAGGGDTLAAIEKYGVEQQISYISTGGGAFLEYVQGKELPAVAVLRQRAAQA